MKKRGMKILICTSYFDTVTNGTAHLPKASLKERILKSRQGRAWVEQHFDYKVMLKKFIRILEN
jgi:hypothetical protein